MSLPVVCCLLSALVCSLGTVGCWEGRQGGCGLELCVRQLRVCGSQLAVCLVSLFVSVCRSCVSSSSVQRPPIPRWCPVRAWLFFTFLPTYLHTGRRGLPSWNAAQSRAQCCASELASEILCGSSSLYCFKTQVHQKEFLKKASLPSQIGSVNSDCLCAISGPGCSM